MFLLRLTMLFAALLLPAVPASAAPALWVVRGPRATVYLFGTVHVLKPGTNWHSVAFDKAFAESSELWLELDGSTATSSLPALIQRLGFDREHPLSSRFSFNEIARLDAIARGAGVAGGAMALDAMRPWLAGFAIGGASMKGTGYKGASGVESQLEASARAAGKPIHGLETAEQQLHVMADLPDAIQEAMLRSTLDTLSKTPAMIDALVALWLRGGETGLKDIQEMTQKYPDLYRNLLVRRNVGFADHIAALANGSRAKTSGATGPGAKGPGTVMVAVGAGHFAGADSVQSLLAKRGIEVRRVDTDPS